MKNMVAGIIMILILGSYGYYLAIKGINSFFTQNELVFNQILKVEIKAPIEIKKREPIIQRIVLDYPSELIDTPIKRYICDKFGPLDCKIALGIIASESNFREDDIHINSNNTVDLGLMQINSVHFKQEGCSPKELLDQYKNVDCGYNIFKASGWSAWESYKNGSFVNQLNK